MRCKTQLNVMSERETSFLSLKAKNLFLPFYNNGFGSELTALSIQEQKILILLKENFFRN